MSRALRLSGGLAVLAITIIIRWSMENSGGSDVPFEPPLRSVEPAPLCPWREPEADLRRVFPEANRRTTETRILSGLRVEVSKQLGRPLDPEEMVITLHRAYQGAQPLGAVLVRRVKAQHGAIEIALAVTEQGRVHNVWLQRLREPATIAAALQDGEWLSTFQNRTHEQGWQNDDLQNLPDEAKISAQAIREGIRSLLILRAASEAAGVPSTSQHHH